MIDAIRTAEDLSKLDTDGLITFLTSGRDDTVEMWNAWRELTSRSPLDFSGVAMRGVDLPEIDLRWMILSGADLFESDLRGAQFYEADLTRAMLDGCTLDKASFRKANLSGACLDGATLHDADLYDAVLCEADLSEADLGGARLVRAQLCSVDLRWANLEGANLRWANLRDVQLSGVGSMEGVELYEASFSGILSLRYKQLLGPNRRAKGLRRFWLRLTNRLYESSIREEQIGHFSEAMDVFASLKGYFEDAGDYEAANWAYIREKTMRKLWRTPKAFRWLYPRWRGHKAYRYRPDLFEWLTLEFAEKIANYGNSLLRPAFWLIVLIALFAIVYWAGGMLTVTPGCSYSEVSGTFRTICRPTYNFFDALLFSLASMSTVEISSVRPYVANVGVLTSLEALLGITLTGLLGFVLGNKLRYS
ncbi:MAG: pentapeptide repeat-containing protein [Anaerolineae bacterium]|nr:pentapeptide repeat-containing protein [Anaerolineae bacterium]